MKWNKYSVTISSEAEDIVTAALMEAGVQGVEIEDRLPLTAEDAKQMFVDILPPKLEDDGLAVLSFYTEEKDEALLARVREELEELKTYCDIGSAALTASQTEDKDWINNWKEFFHQFYIDDILITPSWEMVEKKDRERLIIHMDPGTAFGTGKHETTQLCIRQLRKYVRPDCTVLDVGTGSGILGILALKFGANHIVGTDLDPCAVPAVHDNLGRNDIKQEQFDLIIGNMIDDKKVQDQVGYACYDIVVANILADVLIPLTPVITNQLKRDGIYITSGIIDVKEPAVREAVEEAGFKVLEVTRMGEWVSITAIKE